MKKKLLSLGIAVLFGSFSFFAQNELKVLTKYEINKNVPTQYITPPNMEQLKAEDLQRDRNGQFYRIGIATYTNLTPSNSGLWTILPNGDRLWQMKVKAPGAEALSFIFETFKLYDDASFWVQSMDGKLLRKKLTREDVLDHFQQHIALCFGDEMVLNLLEPKGTKASEFKLEQVMYGYRSTGNPSIQKINESDNCQVNVNCSPEGTNWQDEKRGVARILVVDGGSQGWCSGSLVNNLAQDCKPYFLTALHCGVTSTTSNFNNWKFYFRYEAPGCTSPSTAGTLDDYLITGCVKKATSNDGGGDSGSDFLLVQLGSAANEATTISTLKSANFNAYWNGWDANNTASNAGVGIHHPSGDIKKISAYTSNTITDEWNNNNLQSHWRLSWSATTNGHGVTEGGSSGSPLFNFNGGNSRIIGTLTGGSSYCTATSSPDYYGKMSYHWQSNNTSGNIPLKNFLDPANTGVKVCDGSANPCAVVSGPPVANFSATPTTVVSGGTVAFTDLSTNSPTSWSWVISGIEDTDWSYAGVSSATSQNPQVTFTTVGQYTVTLTASNAQGSDGETKTNYIVVTAGSTTYCTATSTECDEYISTVTLGSINNSSACTNYGNYVAQSTSLTKGQAYQLTIVPTITGQGQGAYTNDEIAAWIDYNGDFDFDDAGERIAYVLVGSGWSNVFSFTVPQTATNGAKRMRVRISYSTDDGPIVPCGSTQYGEVEDYTVNIQGGSSADLDENNPLSLVSVYPNPTSGNMYLDLSALTGKTEVLVFDLTGKLLFAEEVQAGQVAQVSTNKLASGVYQIQLKNNGNESIQRFVKQ